MSKGAAASASQQPHAFTATIAAIGARGPIAEAGVDAAGGLHGDSWSCRWLIGAADRWHDPSTEITRRQRFVDDTLVVETRVRVPGGDAVHRAYSVADGGGTVVIEIENESNVPFAVAVIPRGVPVRVDRKPSSLLPSGVELPPEAVVCPIAHRTRAHIVLAADVDPSRVPDAAQVASGWLTQSRSLLDVELPDDVLMAELRLARCVALVAHDPASRLVARATHDPIEIAGLVAELGRSVRAAETVDNMVPWALSVAAESLRSAGEPKAARDVLKARERLPGVAPRTVLGRVRALLVDDNARDLALLPDWPATWAHGSVDVRGLSTRHGTTSFAVRWHGDRPALLWERNGERATVRCPGLDRTWCSTEAAGDALLAPMRGGLA